MQKQAERDRGRPPDDEYSYKIRRSLEFLSRIAVEYDVDSNRFFDCMIQAWNQQESKCEELRIICREKTESSAVFLFVEDQRVLGQFPLPTEVLRGEDPLKRYMEAAQSRKNSKAKSYEGRSPKIENLEAGMKKVNLKARVVEVPKPKMVYTRFGNTAYVSNAVIEDETGSIRMSLWNNQVHTVSEGDLINIENSKVTQFRGERQIRIGRHGRLNVIE